ncbi:MAG: UbiH/UbiF/VisC/COQ6 family ubiquinone biosynthesis hydroxylase [Rickettsiales bacterium]
MDADIIIAGGGLVGNALALATAQGGLRVAVIDPLPRAQQLEAGFDGRTSAIAIGSVRILTRLGAWPHIAPHAQAIHDIRVCDQDKPGFVHYSDKDVGEPFGYIVENNILRRGLFLALEATKDITVHEDMVSSFSRTPGSAIAQLDSGMTLSAPLLIAADGRFSKLREQAGLAQRVISYGQTAIVCVIEHAHPHAGLALEKFYPTGPFAALPLKPTDAGVNRSGIVWTEHEDNAAHYLALTDDDFNAELQRRLGDAPDNYWGAAKAVGKRFAYPLKLMHAEQFVAERFALVGDAAHGIHPIAGQGVNLGYRDVAVLAELLIEQRRLGLDLGAPELLARYQRWRKFDSVSMTASTDLLNRLFSNDLPGLSLIRRAGLSAVERMPTLKRFFMRHAMGLVGDLPKLMQPLDAA